jgi:hypothetical protein
VATCAAWPDDDEAGEDLHHDDGIGVSPAPKPDGENMKRKILALGLFSLCCLALFAGESHAGFLCHGCGFWPCHNHCVTQITCRPYNAFTPICWGNLVCDGCCPSMGSCCPMPCAPSCGPSWTTSNCQAFAGPNYSHATDMPGAPNVPAKPMPDIRNQPFPPMPMPVGPMGPNISMYPYSGVAQANYYPYTPPVYPNYYPPQYYNPYPAYQPMPYNPYPAYQPMPYYWYPAR